MSLEQIQYQEVIRLNKTIDLQKKIINNQESLIQTKDALIGILLEQRDIAVRAMSDVINEDIDGE